jgi:putative hydrolase of the HAD superfamily
MSSLIRLITFDLDDTLWDVRPALEAAEAAQWSYLNARFPELALAATPPEQIADLRRALLEEKPELMHHISLFRQSFIERLLQHHGVPGGEAESAASEAFTAFLSQRHKVVLYANAESVLNTLRRHFQLGALTNGNADVRKTQIGSCFDFAWRAEEFGVSKPDPALFHQAFEQAGVSADEVIHVGDCHDNDVSGAVLAGAKAIWFSPDGGVSEIASGVVQELSELPAAIERLTSQMGLG